MIADNRLTETSVWYARLLAEQLGTNRAALAASAIFPSNLETGFINDNGSIEAHAPFLMSFSVKRRLRIRLCRFSATSRTAAEAPAG